MSEEKSEKFPNVTQLMKIMIHEMSWKTVKEILASNKNYLAAFQRGGFGFDGKNRPRAEVILAKKLGAENGNEIFFCWYKEQKGFRKILDPYLMKNDSEEPSAATEAEEGASAISEEAYKAILKILTSDHAAILLHYSPELFSDTQKEEVLAISRGRKQAEKGSHKPVPEAENSVDMVRDLKNQLLQSKNREKRLVRNEGIGRKTIEEQRQDIADLSDKNTELKALLQKYRVQMDDRIMEAQRSVLEELASCKEDIFKARTATDDLKAKYERALQQVDIKIKENALVRAQLDEVKNRHNLKFVRILDRLDVQGIILALNEPDDVREKLNTLVRPQTMDNVDNKDDCNELRRRWDGMIKSEMGILEKICGMDVGEINEVYYKNWDNHTDDFNDIIYSLRARAILVKMIHEILWQNKQ